MIMKYPNFKLERKYWKLGKLSAGVDEAGRGALAGPVVAAAVIFDKPILADIGINDSKALKENRREELFEIIIKNVLDYSISFVSNKRIDEINILNATCEAMNNCIDTLKIQPDHLLIDGNRFRGAHIPFSTIIGGDAKSISIAAASILAKVTRDRFMETIAHEKYPVYFFNKNKGYGTKRHFEALAEFGYCEIHRQTFLKRGKSKQMELF